MRHVILGLLLTAVVVATACGGGGGSDGGTVGGGSQSPISAAFTADEPQPPSNSVAMAQGSKSGDLVTVRVNVVGVSGVYGTAFDVTYDSTKADYVSWSAGTLLEQGGNTPNYTVTVPSAGTVVVGASRTGSTGVTASGQAIVNLTFRVKATGTFPVTIQNSVLYDSQNPPQPLPGITWYAGSLTGA
jgi:hypothetical protein